MITGQTQLFCIDANGTTLKKGGVYTYDSTRGKSGFYFLGLQEEEFKGKWFAIHRFEIIDHVDISELTNLLLN